MEDVVVVAVVDGAGQRRSGLENPEGDLEMLADAERVNFSKTEASKENFLRAVWACKKICVCCCCMTSVNVVVVGRHVFIRWWWLICVRVRARACILVAVAAVQPLEVTIWTLENESV